MRKIDELLEKDWYFQGFNGTPALLYGPMYSMFRDMPNFLGYGYSVCIEYFQNDVAYYLYAWDDLRSILKHLLDRYEKDSGYLDWLVDQNEIICQKVYEEFCLMNK
ncbi:MAG: hypothetical protein EXS55_03685, partial [Candidatus Magasanikbacteria bacterium]|nr:hypothetical protein [Candidatus Magasanikbacteria bacterium]